MCSYFSFVVSKDILNKQILPSTEKPPNTDSKLDSSLQVMYDGGKSGIHDSFMQSPSYLGVVEAIPLTKGAFLAQSQRSDIEELFNWLKLKLSATVNLCMVTFINFR